MTLAERTDPGLIIPRLRGRDAPSVIQELCWVLQRERRVPDLLPFYHAALNREFMVSTDIEAGMAFPHARLPGLKELSFAFGRSDAPLGWGPRSAQPVRLVFLIAIPATDSTEYLSMISAMARLTKSRGLVEKLYSANDTFQIMRVFQQIELRAIGPESERLSKS